MSDPCTHGQTRRLDQLTGGRTKSLDPLRREGEPDPRTLFYPVTIRSMIWIRRYVVTLFFLSVFSVALSMLMDFTLTAQYTRVIYLLLLIATAIYLIHWINLFPGYRGRLFPYPTSERGIRIARRPAAVILMHGLVIPCLQAMFLYGVLITLPLWFTLVLKAHEVERAFLVSDVTLGGPSRTFCRHRLDVESEEFRRTLLCTRRQIAAGYRPGDILLARGPENAMGMLIRSFSTAE